MPKNPMELPQVVFVLGALCLVDEFLQVVWATATEIYLEVVGSSKITDRSYLPVAK